MTTPPNDLHAEEQVLGAMLANRNALQDVLDFGLRPSDFYRPAHELVFAAILDLHSRNEPVDVATVMTALHSAGDLGRVGGNAAVFDLGSRLISAANVEFHARTVRDHATRRKLSEATTHGNQAANDVTVDVAEALNAAQAAVAAVADHHDGQAGEDDQDAAYDTFIDELENGSGVALPTGIAEIDHAMTGGLRAGSLTTIGARPAVGKTAFGLSIAMHVAVDLGKPVGFTSLEMTRTDLLARACANVGDLEYGRILDQHARGGVLNNGEWHKLSVALRSIQASGIVWQDRPLQRVSDIRSSIRRLIRKRGECAVWIVDYLGLLAPDDRRAPRVEQVSSISRGLKLTALELGVPIIAMHQLNRDNDKAQREPRLSDLRDSGAVEQDSDNVILLHREDETKPHIIGAFLAKNRRGPITNLALSFRGSRQRIEKLGAIRSAA